MNKKKVLIITFPLFVNYGGILQAYALQSVIKDMGYDVCTDLRWLDNPRFFIAIARFFFRLLKKYILKKNVQVISPYVISHQEREIISSKTRNFVYKHMKTSEIFQVNGLSSNKSQLSDFNTIVVGSDQIWKPSRKGTPPFYLLDFAKNSFVKRIAYAVSFGIGMNELKVKHNDQQQIMLAKLFAAISVREDSGIDLCESLLDTSAVHVLDPTMLLLRERYEELVRDYNEPELDGDLMCYILDRTREKNVIIKKISSALGMRPFQNGHAVNLGWTTRAKIEKCIYPSVTSWLRGFMDAKFVFTDSFHGCIFSIIFNKPFIAMMNKERGSARFTSLLKMFGLEDRLICSITELTESKINGSIDWGAVNHILDAKRIYSMDFLINALRS